MIELGVGYMEKKVLVAVAGSGGVAEIYGGRYLDERNRVPILVAEDARSAVALVLNNIQAQQEKRKVGTA